MNDAPIHILSTKSLDERMIQRAASENIYIDCIPFIKIENINDEIVHKKINQSTKKPYAIFTSANAVKAVAACLQTNPSWKIFCISGNTKTNAEKYFNNIFIAETASYGKDLAEKMIAQQANDLVFFCGDQRLDTIPKMLFEKNILFEEIIVYKTIATHQEINKDYNGIIFFSPSGVESFFYKNQIQDNCISFSIGTTTAKALKKYTEKIIIAAEPDEQAVCDVLIHYFRNQNIYQS
jgi:uroporphyrinogen-III synthase